MTVTEALQLITSGSVEFTQNNFMSITSWHFEYQGEMFRFVQMKDVGLWVETIAHPRTKLDFLVTNEEHPHADYIRKPC